MIQNFYTLPLLRIAGYLLLSWSIWTYISIVTFYGKKSKKCWIYINILLCIYSLFLIFKMTLWNRTIGQRRLELIPFYTLITIPYNDEAIRIMFMNVVLFYPFGLTIPHVLRKARSNQRKWIYCILAGAVLSIFIESMQYCFALGYAEMDDVICNTLGCMLGVTADITSTMWHRKSKEKSV